MRRWGCCLLFCFLLIGLPGLAQDDDAATANTLYKQGKRPDALPYYERLATAFPNEALYQERLADCLGAKARVASEPAEVKALLSRMRVAAKRAIELGDTTAYLDVMANIDPDKPLLDGLQSSGKALLEAGEKAFSAGNYPLALEKYAAAVEQDPKLYEAALFAGDSAFAQHDLATAAKWFARAIAIDPDRETAYRYWGDAIFRYGNDPSQAREKFIDAIVAEPYNKLAWQGLGQWAQSNQAMLVTPKIERPAGPTVDESKPNTTNITLDINLLDEKKNPGGSAWMMYSLMRGGYHGDLFQKDHPGEKAYRHSLQEEMLALNTVASSIKEKNPKKLDESLRNLLELKNAGMLECWILINAADAGIAQDYDSYRKAHRQQLHDYLSRFVVHGGPAPAPAALR